MVALFFVATPTVSAKLPPSEFAAQRLSKTRAEKSVSVAITLFRKTPEDFSGTVKLCQGTPFSIGKLAIKKTTTDTGLRLLWIALASKSIFDDVTKLLGPIDERSRTVEVIDDQIAYRYGNSPAVFVSPKTGELLGIRAKLSDGDWKIVFVRGAKKTSGSILKSGVIYARFTH